MTVVAFNYIIGFIIGLFYGIGIISTYNVMKDVFSYNKSISIFIAIFWIGALVIAWIMSLYEIIKFKGRK